MTEAEERRAIVEVEVVTEKLGGAAYEYLLDNCGKPLNALLRAEVERRMRAVGGATSTTRTNQRSKQ